MAERGVLDVPRHERRYPAERRALRVHVQPQLRRSSGPRRAHPSHEPGDGRGGGGRRVHRGRAGVGPCCRAPARASPPRSPSPRCGEGGGGGGLMEPFVRHSGKAVALPRDNVDTDQIIPKQFLKGVERTGLGPALFYDWRYGPDGTPNPDFELNRSSAQGASILITGANFGCGSSREHAAWALKDAGFRAILAPSFADIFFANCCQNGLLPVRLLPQEIDELFRRVQAAGDDYALTIDLEAQGVEDGHGFRTQFGIDSYRREMLLRGLDEIGRTLLEESRIAAFERRRAIGTPGPVA